CTGTDRSRRADHEKWVIARVYVLTVPDLQCNQIHALTAVDPVNRFRAEAGEISGFLDPRVSFFGGVNTQTRAAGDALLANVPAGLRGAGGQETGDIGHIAPTQKQASAIRRVADELGEPSNYLNFYFSGHRSQFPGTDVRVYGGSQQIGKDTNGSGAGCDVTG